MPTVNPGTKVLVTGANGFLAVWVVRTLLQQGYAVRGVVRSLDKGKYLQDYFKSYGGKFELIVVEDMTKEGAFDEAVKGVDAIEHTASPLGVESEDPDVYIKPAVNGTISILKSALQQGSTVKRIVITSSCGTISNPVTQPVTLDENNWHEASLKEIQEKGGKAGRMPLYLASKTLSEKAAWDFYNTNKDKLSWDLVVLHPPFILGPSIQAVSKIDELNPSMKFWHGLVVAEGEKMENSLKTAISWIDVRDAAEAHARALQKEQAGGQRIIISAGRVTWQEFIDIANAVSPSPALSHPLPRGVPGIEKCYLVKYDTAKAERILKMKYRLIEEMTKDILDDFASRGW